MPDTPDDGNELQAIEEDPLHALGRAATSSAKKDELTISALQMFKRSWRLMAVAVIAALGGIGYGAWQSHDTNTRDAHGYTLLICIGSSQRTLAKDLRTAVSAKHRLPASAIKIPAGCTLVP